MFLKRFNISSIDDLPDYNELLERVKVIRSGDDRLYNHFEVKPEDDEQDVAVAEAPKSENIEEFEASVIGEKEEFSDDLIEDGVDIEEEGVEEEDMNDNLDDDNLDDDDFGDFDEDDDIDDDEWL